jgi:hypothetical protein
MADGEVTNPRDNESTDQQVPHRGNSQPPEFLIEMRDSLPGDRAIIGVEQDGALVWLASRKHIPPNVASEVEEQMRRFVRSWSQNWPGA